MKTVIAKANPRALFPHPEAHRSANGPCLVLHQGKSLDRYDSLWPQAPCRSLLRAAAKLPSQLFSLYSTMLGVIALIRKLVQLLTANKRSVNGIMSAVPAVDEDSCNFPSGHDVATLDARGLLLWEEAGGGLAHGLGLNLRPLLGSSLPMCPGGTSPVGW